MENSERFKKVGKEIFRDSMIDGVDDGTRKFSSTYCFRTLITLLWPSPSRTLLRSFQLLTFSARAGRLGDLGQLLKRNASRWCGK